MLQEERRRAFVWVRVRACEGRDRQQGFMLGALSS